MLKVILSMELSETYRNFKKAQFLIEINSYFFPLKMSKYIIFAYFDNPES